MNQTKTIDFSVNQAIWARQSDVETQHHRSFYTSLITWLTSLAIISLLCLAVIANSVAIASLLSIREAMMASLLNTSLFSADFGLFRKDRGAMTYSDVLDV